MAFRGSSRESPRPERTQDLAQGWQAVSGRYVSLGGSLAAYSGEEAKFAENQDRDVYRLIVADQMSRALGTCRISFDAEDYVCFILPAAAVLYGDQKLPGIVMHGHVFRCGGAPNPEIAKGSFLTGERLFLRH
jgi:hypothetical protein